MKTWLTVLLIIVLELCATVLFEINMRKHEAAYLQALQVRFSEQEPVPVPSVPFIWYAEDQL